MGGPVTKRSALVVMAIAGAGCSAETASIAVSFVFHPPELVDDAVFVDLYVQKEPCFSVDLVAEPTVRLARDVSTPSTLEVDGPVYLQARARDRSCRWFARGCGRVAWPSPARSMEISLRSADALPMCEERACDEGTCEGGDLPEGIAPPLPAPPPDGGPGEMLDDGRDS